MSSPEAPWVVPFSAITRNDLAKVGGKGANLGELTRAGFPVPDGLVEIESSSSGDGSPDVTRGRAYNERSR
jgi:hypothetical protein